MEAYRRHVGQVQVLGRPYSSLARRVSINEDALLALESRQVHIWGWVWEFPWVPGEPNGDQNGPRASQGH